MWLTPAWPRSPVLLSRHGKRCIRHCWRHGGWLSTGHTPPCGRWHRYPRLESADGIYVLPDPAEPWQVGWQSLKRENRTGRERTCAHRNDSRAVSWYGLQVSNRAMAAISDLHHVSPAWDCALAARPFAWGTMRLTRGLKWAELRKKSECPNRSALFGI